MSKKKQRLIFFHVPKCGGVTVYQSVGPLFDRRITSHEPQDQSTAASRTPFIATHTPYTQFRCDPKVDWTATILREPQQRLRSLYRFWAGMKPTSLQDSVKDPETYLVMKMAGERNYVQFLGVREAPLFVHLDNAMVRHFTDVGEKVEERHFEEACRIVEKIDEILFTETLEGDLCRMSDRLGRRSVHQMLKGNVTDELHLHNPDLHALPVGAEIESAEAYWEAIAPLIAYDLRLYAFAKELMSLRSVDRQNGDSYFIEIPGLAVPEMAPDGIYGLTGSAESRSLLWGEWSSGDDRLAWTVGGTCWIRFKVRRSDLVRMESPRLQLDIEASLPEARAMNRVDLEVAGSNARQRLIFLNKGRTLDLQAFARDPHAERTYVVAGDRSKVSAPLAREGGALLEDGCAGGLDAGEFAYFRVDLKNLPNVPAARFGVDDDRRLGVAINELRLWDSAG
jgi:hypothetical protein